MAFQSPFKSVSMKLPSLSLTTPQLACPSAPFVTQVKTASKLPLSHSLNADELLQLSPSDCL